MGWAGAVSSAVPATRRGRCSDPESTEAATEARSSGVTTTRACPMAVAADSDGDVGAGTLPPKAANPRCSVAPMPNCAAVEGKLAAGNALAKPMKAVLQEMAKACSRSSEPEVSPSKLWKTWPLTVIVGGQVAGLVGEEPCSIRSDEVITLKVEPGG